MFLVIERDNGQGPAAGFKKIFLVDFNEVGRTASLVKHLVADLLHIRDPTTSAGTDRPVHVPVPDDRERDPADSGAARRAERQQLSLQQRPGADQPDPNEFIIIRLDRPLAPVLQRTADRHRMFTGSWTARRPRPLATYDLIVLANGRPGKAVTSARSILREALGDPILLLPRRPGGVQ